MGGQTAIEVGNRKQLFIDRRFIEREHGITLRVNPPVKAETIALRPEKPWEVMRTGDYTTVIEDGGVYRMWYDAFVGLDRYQEVPRALAYAESTDGIEWKRVNVNLFDWRGHRENNIVMPGGDGCVMRDPNGKPDERYKAVVAIFANSLWPESQGAHWDLSGGAVYLCTSPDGIRWKRVDQPASPMFHDSQNNLLWDDRIGRYVAYLRTHERGRTVGRIELDDPTQTPWPFRRPPADVKPNEHGLYLCATHGEYDIALATDEMDPPDTDVQTCPIVKYPWAQDVYLGLCALYRHYSETQPGVFRNDGPNDIHLVVSRDGATWTRPQRKAYIGLGPLGGWDAGCAWPILGMIRRGDEILQYYSGTSHTHGDYTPETVGQGGVRAVRQRLDGFVSADADYHGGALVTPLLRFDGSKLVLNVDAGATGFLKVEILDEADRPIEGFSLKDAVEIDRNQIAAEAAWSSGKNVGQLAGRPVRLRFSGRGFRLFAFQFEQS